MTVTGTLPGRSDRGEDTAIDILYRITQELLATGRELEPALDAVLGHISGYFGMERAMITIYDPSRSEICLEAADGLSPSQLGRGRYRLDEGIVGQVIRRGEPALIPCIGEEPLFLDRTQSRKDLDWSRIAFVCVPIVSRKEVLGTISVDRPAGPRDHLEADVRLLTVIAAIIGDAVRNRRDHRDEVEGLRREKARLEELQAGELRPGGMIGTSPQIKETFELIRQVSCFDTTVLLRGESGTGKELAARSIHMQGQRAARPFIAVNCGSLPEHLVASELFGHVRGAYTGAENDRRGRFEMAQGGTIFLDEIGELIPSIQVKLLRVLQEGEIERLGEEKPRKVDVRVIAATNANLERAMEEGRFRVDLFYRLNVFPIYLPPLRERKADITLLADYFVEKHAATMTNRVVRISTPAIELMTAYHWPGNVRELENCIARASLLASDGVIRAHHLPPTLQTGKSSGTTAPGSFEARMSAYEREILIEAMKNASGNQAQAARDLATTPRILAYRLRRHGLRASSRGVEHASPTRPRRNAMKLFLSIALAVTILAGSIAAVSLGIASSRAQARAVEAREASVRVEMAALQAAGEAEAAARRELEARIAALEARAREPVTDSARRRAAQAAGAEASVAVAGVGETAGATTTAAQLTREERVAAAVEELASQALKESARQALWTRLGKDGLLDDVVKAFEERAREEPRNPDRHAELGSAYVQKIVAVGELEKGSWASKADRSFDRALELDPTHWEARFTKAAALAHWPPIFGKSAAAAKQFETLLAQQEARQPEPRFKTTYLFLGNLYQNQGNVAKARETWTRGAELFPRDAELERQLAATEDAATSR